MVKQKMLKVAPLVVISGLMLGGCASTQAWSPALEDAQQTYQRISQDPIVASLAATELEAARRQLTTAEIASEQFRKPHFVNHEAKLAKVKTLVAQQRARALSANHSLQLAIGQTTLLSEEQIIAATQVETFDEPVMAAAHPGADNQQDIATQIAALSQQLADLQAQVQQPQQQQQQQQHIAQVSAAPQTLAQLEASRLLSTQTSEEPLLGAAMATPSIGMPKPLPSATQLKQQLSAINAKPSSQGMSLTLGERYFDQGTARLWNARASRHLDNIASVLNNNPDLVLKIEAHTDNTSDSNDSYNLSTGRAVSVKSALVLRGINANRITATGFGHTRPVAENTSVLGRLQNRRVELIFPNVQ